MLIWCSLYKAFKLPATMVNTSGRYPKLLGAGGRPKMAKPYHFTRLLFTHHAMATGCAYGFIWMVTGQAKEVTWVTSSQSWEENLMLYCNGHSSKSSDWCYEARILLPKTIYAIVLNLMHIRRLLCDQIQTWTLPQGVPSLPQCRCYLMKPMFKMIQCSSSATLSYLV